MSTESINNSELEKLSPNKFYKRIKNEDNDFIILDVRSQDVSENWSLNFDSIKTINYPYFDLIESIPQELEKKLPENKDIIVVCTKGESSELIADKLSNKGYDSVVLENGMNGWSKVYEKKEIPTGSNIKLYQYVRPSSGCLGYMLVSDNEAVVIDPLKQYTDVYVQDAQDDDASIEYVIDTHIHADHISGFNHLSESTGAKKIMYKNAKERGVDYSFRKVKDGDKIEFGDHMLEVINTPGHTTDMTSYYVDNILFTGDSLFLNNIARPDLEDPDKMTDMITDLYSSIDKILDLPDETIIAPGHKFTNNPKKSLNNTYVDYLYKIDNELNLSKYSEDEFIDYVGDDMPPRPSNYSRIIDINKGLYTVSESEEYELELGPNNCSAH